MKPCTLLTLFLASILSTAYAQNESRFIMKISGGTVVDARQYNYPYIDEQNPGGSWVMENNIPHFRFETCYMFNEYFEFGMYAGISKLTVPYYPNDIFDSSSTTTNGYFYGTEVNYHILPLFIKKPLRFDIYGTTKIGMLSKRWGGYDNLPVNTDNFWEIGLGIGASYYFTKKFGVFGEILIGRFYNSNLNWRGGIALKL